MPAAPRGVFVVHGEPDVSAAFAGAVVFVLLREYLPPSETHRYIGMATILLIRLAAMRWKLRLPTYRTRGSGTD
jgi:uncharacterized membrane protein YeiH